MVKKSFPALLADINESYQSLRAANSALEAEVATLRRSSLQGNIPSASSENLALHRQNSLDSIIAEDEPAAGVEHVDITRLSPIVPDQPNLHRALTRDVTPTEKDNRISMSMLPKMPPPFTLPDLSTHGTSAPDEPPPMFDVPNLTKSSVMTCATDKRRDGFSERVRKVTAKLEQPSNQSLNFGMSWEGNLERTDTSVLSMLRRTRGHLFAQGKEALQPFDIFSGVVIITYVIFLGFETEVTSRGWEEFNDAFLILHMIYNAYFLIELIFRLWCFGRHFFMGPGWRLNLLDVLLVASAVLDVGMRQDRTESSSSARMLRSIRVVRLVRTVRIVRAMRDVREFQKMVFAITSSLKTLAYSIVILFFILYFFAVIFTYGAMEAREFFEMSPPADQDYPMVDDLERYWGTFFMAIYSCYLSVSNGQSWYYVVKPLSDYSTVFTLIFISFIALTIFGVLNAITSIFVESSLMSAQHYKDLIILDKAHEKELALNHIRAVFRQIDQDGSGEISAAELEFFLANDALRKYMEALNITTEDTRMLFRLLDLDESGVIDFEEFCAGCMRLKGEARAFDVHVMLLQLRHFVEQWSKFTRFVAEELGVVGELVTVVDSMKQYSFQASCYDFDQTKNSNDNVGHIVTGRFSIGAENTVQSSHYSDNRVAHSSARLSEQQRRLFQL